MVKLPILMYHHVSQDKSEGLTISVDHLESQFAYLARKGYITYHFSELIDLPELPFEKGIVITFDDVYVNQMELAYPLLKEYGLKATFFAPLDYLGKSDTWNQSEHKIMTVEQLQSLNSSIIEFGYHSYHHNWYNECSMDEIEEDIQLCLNFTAEHHLHFSPIIAYPFGKYPRKDPEKQQFIEFLKSKGFHLGIRIGNRINRFPFKNPYEIQRLDIKGGYSFSKFKRKVNYGKLL